MCPDDYYPMFIGMLVFTPILMLLSYLAGTAHDGAPKNHKYYSHEGFKLRKETVKVCVTHAKDVRSPARLVDIMECHICKEGMKK